MMGDFFKPWRRKLGCLMLLMACVFAAGSVRSLTTLDVMIIDNKPDGVAWITDLSDLGLKNIDWLLLFKSGPK